MVSPILSCKCGPKRIGRSRIAQARPGWVNGAHQPFQIAFREDRARRPYRSPAALQGLAGIVIPSRKTQAPHSGQLCSIRGKSGGAPSEAEPYRRVEQTAGRLTSGLALRVALGLALLFSFLQYAYACSWQPSQSREMILRSIRSNPLEVPLAEKPGVDRRFRNPYSSRVPRSRRVLALEFSRTSGRPFEFPFPAVLPGLRKGRGIFWRVLFGALCRSDPLRNRFLKSPRRQ